MEIDLAAMLATRLPEELLLIRVRIDCAESSIERYNAAKEFFKVANRISYDVQPGDSGLEQWLTPIEKRLRYAIVEESLPMCAGVVAHGYWLDFADREKRIAIEADGNAFHCPKADGKRDRNLGKRGWVTYRLTGVECYGPEAARLCRLIRTAYYQRRPIGDADLLFLQAHTTKRIV